MSQTSRQPMSGLASVKREFSTNPVKKEPEPSRAPTAKKSGISDALRRAIEEGCASRDAMGGALSTTSNSLLSNKRPPQAALAPPAKRRTLPDSWQKSSSQNSFAPSVQKSISSSSYTSSATSNSSGRSSSPASSTVSGSTSSSKTLVVSAASSAKATAKPATIFLSNEQKQILKLVKEGKSIFYTGSAGTGKSVLLREIIKAMHKKYAKALEAVAVTASTGIAACNIGGVTIHSFGGIGLGIENAETLADKIRKNRKASARWLRTKVLIIDEVSMVDGELFDKLARIGSLMRRRTEPFGGIQLVVTGDFFQLPPVNKGNKGMKFAFEATTWNEVIERKLMLTKVFRQKDQDFVDMLNEMRFGQLSQKSILRFKSLSRDIVYEDGLGPTELFPRRQDVDSANGVRMSRLRADNQTFYAKDAGTASDEQRKKLLDNFMAPDVLHLAKDAQVMLIKNCDETLVNGSMGRVVRFVDPQKYKDEVLDDAQFTNEKESKPVSKGASAKGSSARVDVQKWPVVEFVVPGGKREVMVMPETWKVELPNGEVQASRTQLPLILAWAMSIHKSQGQTLDRVKVDLARVFEKGQAYVALSRATSLDGLQVLNFNPDKVLVHEKVRAWHRTLEVLSDKDGESKDDD